MALIIGLLQPANIYFFFLKGGETIFIVTF